MECLSASIVRSESMVLSRITYRGTSSQFFFYYMTSIHGPPRSSHKQLYDEIDKNKGMWHKITMALLMFIVVAALPFALVEHPLFLAFVKLLKSSYIPPSAKSVS